MYQRKYQRIVEPGTPEYKAWIESIKSLIEGAEIMITSNFKQPIYSWQWCFNGDWFGMTVNVVKPPCRFYRLMQRLILGIHWRPTQEPGAKK